MESPENIKDFVDELNEKLKECMPKIQEEIKLYEKKLAEGKLTKNPIPGPQFNE